MAWASEVNNNSFIVIDDRGPAGTSWYNCYAKATLAITTSGDTVNYKITMYTEVDGKHDEKPGVSLYLSIDDKVLLKDYWVYSTTSSSWNGFPTKNGSSYSGSITTKTSNNASIPVTFKIATTQNVNNNASLGKTVTKNITRTWYTTVGEGTVFITDNGDNTFTIGGTKGKRGTNNESNGPFLYYSYDSATYNKEVESGAVIKLAGSAPERTVYAKCITKGDYGPSSTKTTSKTVYRYTAPELPKNLKLNYNKSRLTVKEPWVFTWDRAKQSSYSCTGVEGYWVVLKKNGTSIPIKDSSGKTISSNPSSADGHTIDVKDETFTIDPIANGFEPNDVVALGVKPYTINGKSEKVFNSDYIYTDATVQNAGIVRIKVGGSWKEGQVYVKVNNAWKEAETVNVKAGGSWKESQ